MRGKSHFERLRTMQPDAPATSDDVPELEGDQVRAVLILAALASGLLALGLAYLLFVVLALPSWYPLVYYLTILPFVCLAFALAPGAELAKQGGRLLPFVLGAPFVALVFVLAL